jgi:hypothetical protein
MICSSIDTRSELLSSLLDCLWRQWSSLGVPGSVRSDDARPIDPEALLLASTRWGRHDARLMEGAIDWLTANGQRINLLRLRRLHDEWPLADARVLAALGERLSHQSALRKWRGILPLSAHRGEPEPLMIQADGKPMPIMGAPDADFLKHGLLVGIRERKKPMRAPNPMRTANLICSLRALWGVNARAEIVAWLLAHESGYPAIIARETGFFTKTIQHTLNEMEESGHIHSRRVGREKIFWINQADWRFLTSAIADRQRLSWVPWMPLYCLCSKLLEALGSTEFEAESDELKAIHIRQWITELAPTIDAAGLTAKFSSTPKLSGRSLIRAFESDLQIVAQHLRGMGKGSV